MRRIFFRRIQFAWNGVFLFFTDNLEIRNRKYNKEHLITISLMSSKRLKSQSSKENKALLFNHTTTRSVVVWLPAGAGAINEGTWREEKTCDYWLWGSKKDESEQSEAANRGKWKQEEITLHNFTQSHSHTYTYTRFDSFISSHRKIYIDD